MAITEVEAEKRIKEAMTLRYQGKYPEALAELDGLIRILSEIDEMWAVFKTGEAAHQMAVVFQNYRKWSMAIRLLHLTLNLRKGIDDVIGVAYTAFQIPMCRLARGDKKEEVLPSFRVAKKAIEKITQSPISMAHPRVLGDMFQNLAYIDQQEGDIAAATDAYLAALDWRGIARDYRGRALTLARLAECCLERNEIGLAEKWAKEALQIFQEIGDDNRIKQVEAVLTKIQEKEKN